MKDTAKPLFCGLPTKIDVDKLMELFKQFKEGDIIPYIAVEQHGSITRHTGRYGSVVSSWRRRLMREENVLLIAVANEGYRIAPPAERMNYSANQTFQGRRRIMRASVIASATDPGRLSDEHKRLRDHLQALPARLRLAELTAPKQLSA